ncbi:MAG: ABC transporter permease [Bacteroidia bacterium]|nr:ABC transporter permease [Bacteroidia bacterium]
MIVKIAWRNIWRNKKRSFVVIGAVTFGICAATFVTSFMNSFMNGFVDNLIDNQYSHIQIHHSEFKKDKDVKFHIQNSESLLKEISSLPNIQAFTNRVISNGMIATANDVRGVQIIGVNSELETSVTSLNTKISEGKSLDETKKKNAILISDRLAKKLKAKIRSKVILHFKMEILI